MNLFKKVLIANRGEIAVRIIRSAKELGIETVSIYAPADEDSMHVDMADEAFCLHEGNELNETYLNIDKIIRIASESGCEAIHPGYGFLAENPVFVKACEDAGIVFIGPNSRSIRLMGNKIESRAFVKKIGIPMTEGITGDMDTLLEKADTIALPILVKAAAGGGGKGMRIVHDLKDLPGILESTSREAKSYFGDESIFIEKYVEEPRHIEIQVIGDNHGNAVHLFERECSIQRRYQKIIEESPSPTLTPEVRLAMGEAAVKISKEIGYNNAGTVEFLVDKQLNFYFLEMNTRVQVEHPVTEMVTGIDIVREQILIAAGNPLSMIQEQITQQGHAIECRIYAEDPANNFLPSPGVMCHYLEPSGDYLRIDTGISEATTIHSFYDPMISKLVLWGENREIARERTLKALKEYIIHGIETNVAFLIQVLNNQAYIDNNITTKYCDEHLDDLISLSNAEKESISPVIPAMAYLVYSFHEDLLLPDSDAYNIWEEIGYWRDLMYVDLDCEDEILKLKIDKSEGGYLELAHNNESYQVTLRSMELGSLQLVIDGHAMEFYVSSDEKGQGYVSYNGHIFRIKRNDILVEEDVFGSLDSGSKDAGDIVSPMPGKVIKIYAAGGQEVKKGEVLLVVEAMKMENNIVSPRDGKIEKVLVAEGKMVDGSTELVVLESGEAE